MPSQKLKTCPRCNASFECTADNIVQCQCFGIVLSAEENAWLEQQYTGCLCPTCLQQIKLEVHLYKEKYIFR